ncbi:FMN-binding protein [Salisediminibacterium selenitireducens]|uniref:FMN-binding domain protein n=1 Tax=Bacillus selenitireducens (strain ATCC 700615 / DSM 15326 / MLS10) TaxID=439292 RepID=D6XWG8_BACIE|nr:FMN-binding protein [Salisediminibacterium selenitireducens]ADH97810.1 FMN-binding domain protein [[Bacillus] selenitireducens MLS10]
MKKTWMLSIISATVILGACGNYDSSSEPLPYDNRVDEGESQAADEGNENNGNGDEETDFGDLADGVYETTGEGYNDDIVVETTIEGGEIVSVEILSHDETYGIGTDATDELPGTIVDANSPDVDGVSGATYSSDGIKEAVRAALEEASGGGSDEDLALTDGVFETSAEGYNDDIVVETTIEGGEIVVSHTMKPTESEPTQQTSCRA